MGKEQKINEIKRSIDYRSIGASYKKLSMDYRKEIKDDSSPGQYVQRCIAEKLLQKLGEPKSWKFYLKCAYNLPESKIWDFVELAMRPNVKDHNRYFVFLANREMRN